MCERQAINYTEASCHSGDISCLLSICNIRITDVKMGGASCKSVLPINLWIQQDAWHPTREYESVECVYFLYTFLPKYPHIEK